MKEELIDILEKRCKELLYNFGEENWNILTVEGWEEFINKDVKFSEKQLDDLYHFSFNLIEDILPITREDEIKSIILKNKMKNKDVFISGYVTHAIKGCKLPFGLPYMNFRAEKEEEAEKEWNKFKKAQKAWSKK